MEVAENCYAPYFSHGEKIREDSRSNCSVADLTVHENGNVTALDTPAIRFQRDERQARNVERREMSLLRG